ncbi:MAG: flagellar hook-basal body protein [Planctomycetota bacterium]|jgi:flagellar basal body rod protein FlgG
MGSYGEASLVKSMSYLAEAQANLANNLANANTIGYKRSEAIALNSESRFQGMLDADLPSVQFGKAMDWRPGIPEPTNEKFHVAIEGEQFFRVRDNQGNNFYTRRGDLNIDSEGFLSTPSGARYLDINDQPIQVGAVGDLAVAGNGDISSADPGADSDTTLGTLGMFLPNKPTLQSVGSGLYRDTANKLPTLDVTAAVQQGSLERSNVEVITELVRMIEVQRSFQSVSKALTSVGRLKSSFNSALNR